MYYFGQKDKVELFVCFALKCESTSAFLIRLPNWFSMCLNSDRKILPLYDKLVKFPPNFTRTHFDYVFVFSEVCLKYLKVFVLSWLHCRILQILVPSQAGVFQ